jgi:hypothetical protein
MERYLLVRDSDGAVVDELNAESILRLFKRAKPGESWLRGLSLVKITDHSGEIVGTTSVTAVHRAEFAPAPRRRRT